MKKIGFLGGYDKLDMLIYVAKILSEAKKQVLLIDATINQKAKYIVPTIDQGQLYITEFSGFDVAVGFENIEEIEQYIGNKQKQLNYDIILMDIDTPEAFRNFEVYDNDKNYFVTAFDLYSLKKGLEILRACNQSIELRKVIFSNTMSKEENQYLDYLSSSYKIIWHQNIINFPLEFEDYSVTVDNQALSRIRIRGLSELYKKSLNYLITFILDDEISTKEISKIIKKLEKEV